MEMEKGSGEVNRGQIRKALRVTFVSTLSKDKGELLVGLKQGKGVGTHAF